MRIQHNNFITPFCAEFAIKDPTTKTVLVKAVDEQPFWSHVYQNQKMLGHIDSDVQVALREADDGTLYARNIETGDEINLRKRKIPGFSREENPLSGQLLDLFTELSWEGPKFKTLFGPNVNSPGTKIGKEILDNSSDEMEELIKPQRERWADITYDTMGSVETKEHLGQEVTPQEREEYDNAVAELAELQKTAHKIRKDFVLRDLGLA